MRLARFAVLLSLSPAAMAAEGMWTLDNLPREALKEQYGFAPDQRWLDHAMRASARIAGGCSASFVSPGGLVLTNHHCVLSCIHDLSSKEHDYVANGFVATSRAEEKQCPGMEINRLEQTTDVTQRIGEVTAGLTGKAYNDAKKAEQSKIEAECVGRDSANTRCDIVELYQGGVQHLYRYARFQDVRLVFGPEYAAGFFGGDPDNFNFPRYNLDMGLLRVYRDGKPIAVKDYFPFNVAGAQEGELVMTLGNPGSTQRLLTVAQLETQRDVVLPLRLVLGAELRGMLTRFSAESPEHARMAQSWLFGVENGFKARSGQHLALLQHTVMDAKRSAEQELRAWVAADVTRRERFGDPWEEVAKAEAVYRDLYTDHLLVEGGLGFFSDQVGWAKTLVRGAAERAKPDGQRLREFAEAGLPAQRAQLLAQAPFFPELDKMRLGWSLAKLRERLGTDHPFVKSILGKESPQAVADAVVDGSRLADVKLRESLWEGGAAAVAASDDPAIVLFRKIDPVARELRARMETEVESVEKRAAERLAQARFAFSFTRVYPDATFSLRLSYGEIRGWNDKGAAVPPFTVIGGFYERATGTEPYKLPARWEAAKDSLDLKARFNQVSTNDIIGGNSGSPLINARGEIVGLAFDGNIHSLGGAYFFDERMNRTVSVHPAAMIEALKKVYGAGVLAAELGAK